MNFILYKVLLPTSKYTLLFMVDRQFSNCCATENKSKISVFQDLSLFYVMQNIHGSGS
jgi:hypothetical protein